MQSFYMHINIVHIETGTETSLTILVLDVNIKLRSVGV
jgi:hypothetical protein